MTLSMDYVQFDSNYIWIIRVGDNCIVVDPGVAAPVERYLSQHNLKLHAILLTHYHGDHINGCEELNYPGLPIYGPAYESIDAVNHPLKEGVSITLCEQTFDVLFTPGHTSGHITYVTGKHMFCGDVMFSVGCGRVFEGTPSDMLSSLKKLTKFPGDTLIYAGHEYTKSNCEFALTCDPNNPELISRYNDVMDLDKNNKPTLPTQLSLELDINPFLRCKDPEIKASAEGYAGKALNSEVDVFATIRQWKNEGH